MGKQANPTAIGAFVVGAIALVVVGIIVFAKANFLNKQDKFVIYFEGTVNGLRVGAPVKLKGVQVGQVTEIGVELNLDEAVVKTPVFIEVDMSDVKVQTSDDPDALSDLTYVSLIRHGLRAQLKSESLLTGRLYVEINFYPKSPIHLAGGNVQFEEIPSLPSETEEFIHDVGVIIGKLKKLPLKELFSSLLVTAKSLETLVNSPQTAKNVEQLSAILASLSKIVNKLDQQLDPLVGELGATVVDTRKFMNNLNQQVAPLAQSTERTLLQAQRSLTALENATGEDSPLYVELSATLEELSDASRSIRTLSDYLQRNPDSILFGKPERAEE